MAIVLALLVSYVLGASIGLVQCNPTRNTVMGFQFAILLHGRLNIVICIGSSILGTLSNATLLPSYVTAGNTVCTPPDHTFPNI